MNTLDDVRRFAVSGLFGPVTLARAIDTLGFVQADPIRAPARAQDLTLRPRVDGYRAGDLERLYPALPVEEDVFINYGFVTRSLQALMHPRAGAALSPTASNKRAQAVLAFVRERGTVHPREVDAHFAHGRVTNYWGGSSSATTHLLEAMHYKGLLRVARREAGIRIYAVQQHGPAPIGAAARRARVDQLIDVVVRKYAPVPAASLSFIVGRLRYAVPQWRHDLAGALRRAKARLSHVEVEGHTWYWPAGERASTEAPPDAVRLLAPFDPVVWDRRRFELLWGWAYRFEAYTPVSKRRLGYYALPLLWRDRVIGWANLSMENGTLRAEVGYVAGARPRDRAFRRALEAELERMRGFLRPEPRPEASR
ncbi:MAG: cytoplasmic protein [Acidobacteria bacterium RIFCSPLOWO2_12_FULL_67_14b]|nr:MAG: cytoplasmic protein [Acidobacteria bacterium RIFCSPLOWO2_12_FULL_67_14b]